MGGAIARPLCCQLVNGVAAFVSLAAVLLPDLIHGLFATAPMCAVLGMPPVPHLFAGTPPASGGFQLVLNGAGVAADPEPRAAQLNDDSGVSQKLGNDVDKFFRGLGGLVGFVGGGVVLEVDPSNPNSGVAFLGTLKVLFLQEVKL